MAFKDIYESVKWIDKDFFFPKNVGWGSTETSIVGVIADFVLCNIPGDILEIGCGLSSVMLMALSKKYNRKLYLCDPDIAGPRLSGIENTPNFSPDRCKVFPIVSDEMFAKNKFTPLAFSFIDGYHDYHQAKREFIIIEKYTVPNGYILLHDTYPPDETWCGPEGCGGCGDVYLLKQELEKDNRFDVLTFASSNKNHVTSTLVRKKPENRPYYQE